MKHKIWLAQLPIVALFSFALYVTEWGAEGQLESAFLREKAFPQLQMISGLFTNAKFQFRGAVQPKHPIVIVEIDSDALSQIGRWPWHRDYTSYLIEKTFDAGARVVGLDMVFSEVDKRVPDELAEFLGKQGMGARVREFETDLVLAKTIQDHRDKLVLGWTTENICQPAYSTLETCPLSDPQWMARFPKNFEKFAYSVFDVPGGFKQDATPLLSMPDVIANIEEFNAGALHGGYFNAFIDKDGTIRRTNMVMTTHGAAFPSLPLEMARIILDDKLALTLNTDGRIASLGFEKSKRTIPVTPLGAMEINFRGPSRTFQYVSALDIMRDEDQIQVEKLAENGSRTLASVSKKEVLKGAYVFIGLSALGVFDLRSFPFDSHTPGVEGHATILDNILAGDMLVRNPGWAGSLWLFLLMVVGAIAFAMVTERLESIPALLLFLVVMSGLTVFDLKVLFENNVNWNTSLFYLELVAIFAFTLAIKYVKEERNKKFIRTAFSKYVAPAIIDSIIKDPTKLAVGGERRDLTILFSDIRGFTSFSERLDARNLAHFLNDYLGIMTDIVFECEGTLDKYIGDAVMAFWGAPLDQPNHAANSCKAAIRMMEALAKNKERFKTQYGVDVNIGIGINSGSVSVGNMGSERIFEYTVIGDHVNLASRLEGLTKHYSAGIVTSRFTFDHIVAATATLPPHRVLDFVKVKGKKNAVELIQVLEREYSPDGLRNFEEARKLYSQRKWDEAIQLFRKADELLRAAADGKDGPSQMYLERCEELKKTPPAPDWDGSWEMHSK